jgi:V8-like Glu-specific endopeptidase
MFRRTGKTVVKIIGTLTVIGLFGISAGEKGSAAPTGAQPIVRKDFKNAKPIKWKPVSSTDYELLGKPSDLFTTSNEYITAEEQIKDPQGSARRLSGSKGSTVTQTQLVKYEDGTVSLSEPPPLTEQVDPKITFNVSSLDEATADAQKVAELLASGKVTWSKTAGSLHSSVIGSDNRTRATPTNYYPRNAIGQLTLGDGTVCSAVLYSSNRVVTAAHCLYNNGWKGFPNWKFRPGRDGSAIPTECGVTGGFILGGYPSNNSIQNDFGGVKLDCNIAGSVGNGYYPQVAISSPIQSFVDGLYVVGYPVNAQGQYVVGQQWEDVGRVIYDTSFLKSINTDQTGGQSGGLWAIPCNAYGYYYCEIGPVEGGSIFLTNPLNAAHQLTASDLANLANF